ncbi:hypothetical protein GCM10009835_16740 [Planosporangium flavigriseum]|uniref:Uncharacterized protein n=1 Tax=Planosporangium flavigriseum TaxID=373681 RepID=A0A8J3LSA9_9ACTN|nr:hypothetical protein Pfl04_50980 [Planosporangium flavigriseum]
MVDAEGAQAVEHRAGALAHHVAEHHVARRPATRVWHHDEVGDGGIVRE